MKKILSVLISAAVVASVIPTAAADDYINKSDNFESYTVGDNWKTSLPSGWRIFSEGDTSTAEIKIAEDPENPQNKVLKLKGISQSVASENSSTDIYDRIIFQSNGGSSYAPKSDRNIVLRTKCYVVSDTVSGLYSGSASGTGKNVTNINAIATNSLGGGFSILYLRKDGNNDAVVYKRSGKNALDYYADVTESFPSGCWTEVVHVLSTANGLAEYRQYIDGELTVLNQKNGDEVYDLKANGYDGNASTSTITNMYGISNAIITAPDAVAGKEPTMYIDDVAIFEVDASKRLTVSNLTSNEVTNEFDLENDSINLSFSEEITSDVLASNIYVTDGENVFDGAIVTLGADGKTASVYLNEISGISGGATYKLCVGIGMHDKQYIPVNEIFEAEFTVKEAEQLPEPEPEPEPVPGGSVINEVINENMESYEIDDNWLTSAPEGWKITQKEGNLPDAEVKIVADPADENNKVLKITPGMQGAKNHENINVFATTGGLKTTDENPQKILVKMKLYIPSESIWVCLIPLCRV